MPVIKYVYWSSIEEEEEHGKTVKYEVLHRFYKSLQIFSQVISFQHVLDFDVVEVKLNGI